ncbi:hypothetical protein PMAYCL1PPCAC_28444, partial [Pristionchus mayeri]
TMASLPPPQQFYGAPSFFHAANQSTAIRNSVFLNLGYIPIYFLALCIYKNPNIVRRYKNTIVFAGAVQYVLTLPYTIFNTWLAIYVNHEVETTVFLCTFVRMGTSLLNFVSFNALTAISISRLLLIVFKKNCGLVWNLFFFIISSLPIVADVIYMFFVSRPTPNEICGPLLFYYELNPLIIWNGYIFGIPLIAVLLNTITAAYLLYRRYSAGVRTEPWLKELIESSGYMTTGLNMIASMVCIQHFRQMLSAQYFSLNSTFLSSYRHQAYVLAPIFWSNLLPVAFIIHCALKYPKRIMPYAESVLFPTFTQALMTVPNASYLTWFALAIGQDVPTNVFLCTSPKIIASSFTYMSFSTITALAVSRFLTIVCGLKTGLKFTVILSIIFATPFVAVVALIHFDGFLYPNDVCTFILFLKPEHLPPYYAYTFAVPTLAVFFNILTVIFLLQYRLKKSVKINGSSAIGELHIALSLFLQIVIPFITVGARGFIAFAVSNQYGTKFDY